MFVTADDFRDTYTRIKERALQRDCSVLIFVSHDADAVCAARVFTGLLRADFVRFKLVPVASYTDLTTQAAALLPGAVRCCPSCHLLRSCDHRRV